MYAVCIEKITIWKVLGHYTRCYKILRRWSAIYVNNYFVKPDERIDKK